MTLLSLVVKGTDTFVLPSTDLPCTGAFVAMFAQVQHAYLMYSTVYNPVVKIKYLLWNKRLRLGTLVFYIIGLILKMGGILALQTSDELLLYPVLSCAFYFSYIGTWSLRGHFWKILIWPLWACIFLMVKLMRWMLSLFKLHTWKCTKNSLLIILMSIWQILYKTVVPLHTGKPHK